MPRTDRQLIIPGWNQRALADSTVAVYGRGWVGAYLVWALRSLGVGGICWLGGLQEETRRIAEWLLSDGHAPDSQVYDYPFAIERASELEWVLGQSPPAALVVCTNDLSERLICEQFAELNRVPRAFGTTAGGGIIGYGNFTTVTSEEESPVSALVVASHLADAVRFYLSPLPGELRPSAGRLGLFAPADAPRPTVWQAGVGGIGVCKAERPPFLPIV